MLLCRTCTGRQLFLPRASYWAVLQRYVGPLQTRLHQYAHRTTHACNFATGFQSATFRGRALVGQELSLPKGVSGAQTATTCLSLMFLINGGWASSVQRYAWTQVMFSRIVSLPMPKSGVPRRITPLSISAAHSSPRVSSKSWHTGIQGRPSMSTLVASKHTQSMRNAQNELEPLALFWTSKF